MAELGLVLKVLVHQGNGQLAADKLALPGHGDGLAQGAGQAVQTRRGAGMEQVAVHGLGQGQAVLDAVETGGQDQADDQIRVARGVGPAQLNAAVLAVGAGQTHELAAVLAAPAHVQRGLVCAQARVGVGHRVAERRQLPRVGQDARHKMSGLAVGRKGTVKQVLAVPQQRDIDVQTAARLVGQRLGHEAGKQTVAGRNGLDGALEGVQIVGGFQRRRVAEADLVLAVAALVVAVLGVQAHFLNGKADLPADVLAFVQRRDVKIAAYVQRNAGRAAVLVGLEQVELALAADVADKAHGAGTLDDGLQVAAAVALKRLAVGQGDVAVHADDAALGGAPRQHGGGVRVRPEHKVALLDVHEPGDGRPVEADTLGKGAGQLTGKKRNVFLVAENIAECQFCELNIVVLNKIENVLCGAFHRNLL